MISPQKTRNSDYYLSSPEAVIAQALCRPVATVLGGAVAIDDKMHPFHPRHFRPEALSRTFKSLMDGRHPVTGTAIASLRSKPGSYDKLSPGGIDVTHLPPKSTSILATLCDVQGGDLLTRFVNILQRASLAGLRDAMAKGLLVTRRNNMLAPIAQCAVFQFPHLTSRDEDMLVHVHNVVIKSAIMPDRKVMQLEPLPLFRSKPLLAARIRAEEIRMLRDEIGIDVEPDGREYRISGCPSDLIRAFSKRRATINQFLSQQGKTSSRDRAAATRAALDTRSPKTVTELPVLMERWKAEAAELGYTPDPLWTGMRRAAETARRNVDLDPHTAADKALRGLALEKSVFSLPDVERAVADSIAALRGVDRPASTFVADLIKAGEVVPTWTAGPRPLFFHRVTEQAERDIIGHVHALSGKAGIMGTGEALQVMAGVKSQGTGRNALATALSVLTSPGLALVQSAGHSIEFTFRGLVHSLATDICGMKVITASPGGVSPQGEKVIPLSDVTQGDVALDEQTLLILLSADQAGTHDLERLLRRAAARGTHVVLIGDPMATSTKGQSAPFRMLCRLMPSHPLAHPPKPVGTTIEASHWMPAVAADLAAGQVVRAIETFDVAGMVDWVGSPDQAMAMAVQAFWQSYQREPDHRRMLIAPDATFAADLVRKIQWLLPSSSPSIDLSVLPLGEGTRPRDISLTQGDEIIMGEALTGPDWKITRGDFFRITWIDTEQHPARLTLRRLGPENTGQEMCTTMEDLTGPRLVGQPKAPRLRHVYDLTPRIARQFTAESVIDLHTAPRNQADTVASMTRHKRTYRLVVALERIMAGIGKRKASASHRRPLSLATLKLAFLAEAEIDPWQQNVSDSLPASLLPSWAQGKLSTPAPAANLSKSAERNGQDVAGRRPLMLPGLWRRLQERWSAPQGLSRLWADVRTQKTDESGAITLMNDFTAYIVQNAGPAQNDARNDIGSDDEMRPS